MKRWIVTAMMAMALAAAPKAAQAAIIIDFGGVALGGTLTDLGGGNWAAANIPVPMMLAINTPSNSGGYLTGGTAAGGAASLSFNTTPGNNFIQIEGWVSGLGVGSAQNPVILLSGSFSSFSVAFPPQGGVTFSGQGPDTKNADLLTALGLPANTPFALFGTTTAANFAGQSNSCVGTSCTPYSTDIANTAVPEPGSLLLLGGGLLGLATIARRRSRKAQA